MAHTFSTAKIASSFLAKEISAVASRRGLQLTVEAQGGSGASAATLKKGCEEVGKAPAAWVPDPKTGYYRPENAGETVDPVILRETLLNTNTRSGQ